MFGRLWHIAPALAVALVPYGCSELASDPPPGDIAGAAAAGSLKDAGAPSVVQAAATKVTVAPMGKESARLASTQFARAQPQDATSCKTDSDCVVILAALINDPKRRWIGQTQSAAELC